MFLLRSVNLTLFLIYSHNVVSNIFLIICYWKTWPELLCYCRSMKCSTKWSLKGQFVNITYKRTAGTVYRNETWLQAWLINWSVNIRQVCTGCFQRYWRQREFGRTYLPIELSQLLSNFLTTGGNTNTSTAEVIGNRKREIGLVVSAK